MALNFQKIFSGIKFLSLFIDQMKSYYREHGQKYFVQKNWSRALSYFERYYLIDIETKEINKSKNDNLPGKIG